MPETPPDHSERPIDEQLVAAYRSAHYLTPAQTLRIAAPHPELDDWLRERGHTHYAVLTAYNPRSSRLPSAINAVRHRRLVAELVRRRLAFAPACGYDPAGAWPAEFGVLLLDAPAAARDLGRRFGQHALVEGRRGGVPRLRWL